MKSKSINIDSSQLAFKINLYILRELIESGLIRDEYNIQSDPNKKNKYLLVVPSEEEVLMHYLSESINLIKLGWLFDLVISFNLMIILFMIICILFD